MASTNKTPQLGLNQWAAGDPVLREDFNRDNAILETMISRGACVTGDYIGNGVANRHINVGFKPRFIMAMGRYGTSYGLALLMPSCGWMTYGDRTALMQPDKLLLSETGIHIVDPLYLNSSDYQMSYIAFY